MSAPRTVAVDLNAVVVMAVESMQSSSRHVLVSDVDLMAEMVQGDPDRLHRAVAGLLSNGVKHTRHGGRVEMWTRVRGRCLEVSVWAESKLVAGYAARFTVPFAPSEMAA